MAGENFDKNTKSAKAYADALDAVNKKTEFQEDIMKNLSSVMGIAYGGFIKQIEKSNEQKREELKLTNQQTDALKNQQKSAGKSASEMLGISEILKKSTSQQQIFNNLIGVSLGDIKDIKGLEEEIFKLDDKKSKLQIEGKKLNKEDEDFYTNLKLKKDEIYKAERDSNKKFEEEILANIDNNDLLSATLKAQGVDLSNNADVLRAINKLQEDGTDTLSAMASLNKNDLGKSYEKNVDNINKANTLSNSLAVTEKERNRLAKIQSESMRDQVGIQEKLIGLMEKNSKSAIQSILDSMKEVNQSFKDAQKDFGFIFDESNYSQMADVTREAARFGMSTKDTMQMMGQLGEELKTIDQNYLADSVKHFTAIQKATGISSEDVTTIAGEMMRTGTSAAGVESAMDAANVTAKMFGVNTKKILKGVAKNIDKMRTMGFQGGEESLVRMAARAERLNMNIDEMFDVAKKARSIEGAMEMASELQLAGGSFANIDPMSLLAAARKGPEELQKILTQMGGDIGKFNKETGALEFDAIDADRLQMVADATGQTVDSIQKGLMKAASDSNKIEMFKGVTDGLEDVDAEMVNSGLSDMMKLGEGGKIEFDANSGMAKRMGIDSLEELQSLSGDELKKKMEEDVKTLAKQAEANQSFDDSITAFKQSVMTWFVQLQPFIDGLTSFVQVLTNNPILTGIVAAMLAFVAIGPKLISGFGNLKEGAYAMTDSIKNIKEGGIKNIFSRAEPKNKDELPGLKDSKDQTPGGSKGGLQSLAEGLKAMGDKDVFKGIGAVALAGPALLLMLAGMPTVLLMGLVGAMGKVVEFGFTSLARGISAMGQAKGLIKGAIAMVIVGAALIPFAFALQMMSDISWKAVGIAMVMMLGGVLTLMAIGAIMMTPAGAFLLTGALALVAVGVALMAFGASLMIFATAANMMQGMEFGWLGDLGWNLLIAGPGLLLGGLALLVASPGLILGSIGLIALGVAAQGLSGIDWAAFASIGDALLSLVPGLIGFSIAGLMFANPITLLGMLMMIGNLGMLAAIMTPLAMSLNTGADGLDRFAEGLTKLQAAANSLDFERLEALKDLSIGMASSGAGGGLSDSVDKIVEALAALNSKGGGGGGGTKKIQVDLKLNGRDLQSIIIDDTEIVS